MIKTVFDSKRMAVTRKVVKLVHIYSCSFVCHNLENNDLKLQANPTAADSTNISGKMKMKMHFLLLPAQSSQKECMHYNKTEYGGSILFCQIEKTIHDCNASGLHYQGSKFIFGFGSTCATRCKF